MRVRESENVNARCKKRGVSVNMKPSTESILREKRRVHEDETGNRKKREKSESVREHETVNGRKPKKNEYQVRTYLHANKKHVKIMAKTKRDSREKQKLSNQQKNHSIRGASVIKKLQTECKKDPCSH